MSEQEPKKPSNRKIIYLILIVSVVTAIIVIVINHETITKVSTTTSILTDFPIQLFDEGYDMICRNYPIDCLVQVSEHLQLVNDDNNGRDMYSFRAINDTTIQMYDMVDGYEKQFTSYHFYKDGFKISNPLTAELGKTIWYVQPR